MADTKITALSSIAGADTAAGDLLPIVDVSDTTMNASGTTKRITRDELATAVGVTAHLADTSDAHDASAISFSATGNLSSTDVQAAITELDSEKAAVAEPIAAAHIADSSAAHAASAVSFSATGNIAATDVQAAIAELDSEKIAAATLTVDGDILTRASGVPAPITRANLAADAAFSALYVPKAGDRVWVDATSLAAVYGSPTLTSALGSGSANDAAWSMADAGSRGVGGSVMLPDHWSTFKIELYHGNTTTTAGNVRWNVTAKYAGSGDVPYVGTGALTASDLTVAAPTTAGAIGVAQIPASSLSHTTGKPLFFAVARYGSDAADTLTNAALVYGVLFTRLT